MPDPQPRSSGFTKRRARAQPIHRQQAALCRCMLPRPEGGTASTMNRIGTVRHRPVEMRRVDKITPRAKRLKGTLRFRNPVGNRQGQTYDIGLKRYRRGMPQLPLLRSAPPVSVAPAYSLQTRHKHMLLYFEGNQRCTERFERLHEEFRRMRRHENLDFPTIGCRKHVTAGIQKRRRRGFSPALSKAIVSLSPSTSPNSPHAKFLVEAAFTNRKTAVITRDRIGG